MVKVRNFSISHWICISWRVLSAASLSTSNREATISFITILDTRLLYWFPTNSRWPFLSSVSLFEQRATEYLIQGLSRYVICRVLEEINLLRVHLHVFVFKRSQGVKWFWSKAVICGRRPGTNQEIGLTFLDHP
jgi:hypothetical protein